MFIYFILKRFYNTLWLIANDIIFGFSIDFLVSQNCKLFAELSENFIHVNCNYWKNSGVKDKGEIGGKEVCVCEEFISTFERNSKHSCYHFIT